MLYAESYDRPSIKAAKSHLFQAHGRFDTRKFPGLTIEQLDELHDMFHENDISSIPHFHATDEMRIWEPTNLEEYFDGVVKLVKGEVSE